MILAYTMDVSSALKERTQDGIEESNLRNGESNRRNDATIVIRAGRWLIASNIGQIAS
jgi:hypothetical protein